MKEIPLSRGKVAIIDDTDAVLVSKFKWWAQETNKEGFYAVAKVRGVRIRMHHLILGDGLIDHKNCNGLDNRRDNLRFATRSQNSWNRRKNSNGSSRFKGVSRHKRSGKWQAWIQANRQPHWLGEFDTEEAAALAYNEAAKKLFGEFARINDLN